MGPLKDYLAPLLVGVVVLALVLIVGLAVR
jgi:hypothetical protein